MEFVGALIALLAVAAGFCCVLIWLEVSRMRKDIGKILQIQETQMRYLALIEGHIGALPSGKAVTPPALPQEQPGL